MCYFFHKGTRLTRPCAVNQSINQFLKKTIQLIIIINYNIFNQIIHKIYEWRKKAREREKYRGEWWRGGYKGFVGSEKRSFVWWGAAIPMMIHSQPRLQQQPTTTTPPIWLPSSHSHSQSLFTVHLQTPLGWAFVFSTAVLYSSTFLGFFFVLKTVIRNKRNDPVMTSSLLN